jgi:hypothetical protein
MLIGEAASEGLIALRLRGASSDSTSACVLDVTSRSNQQCDVAVPRGTQFVPQSDGWQVMVCTGDSFVTVPAGGSASSPLSTLCGSPFDLKPPPTDGSIDYAVAPDLSPVLTIIGTIASIRPDLEQRADVLGMPADQYVWAVTQYVVWRMFETPPRAPACDCTVSLEVTPDRGSSTLQLVPGYEPARWDLQSVGPETVQLVAVLDDDRPLFARRYTARFVPSCKQGGTWGPPTFTWGVRAATGLVTLEVRADATSSCPHHPDHARQALGEHPIALERVPGRVRVMFSGRAEPESQDVGIRVTAGEFDVIYRFEPDASSGDPPWTAEGNVVIVSSAGAADEIVSTPRWWDRTVTLDPVSGDACDAIRRYWHDLAAAPGAYRPADRSCVTHVWRSLTHDGMGPPAAAPTTESELEARVRSMSAAEGEAG